jgi:hypothetical protein
MSVIVDAGGKVADNTAHFDLTMNWKPFCAKNSSKSSACFGMQDAEASCERLLNHLLDRLEPQA